MTSNRKSNDRSSRKTPQPMMQILEPRRLMSLSGAIEFPTPGIQPGGAHFHSFGFESHFAEGIPPAEFGGPADRPGPPPLSDLEAQLASAIARGVSVSITPATAATPTPVYTQTGDHSLSALYASLGTSTLTAIDNAAVVSETDAVAQSSPTPSTVSITPGATPVHGAEIAHTPADSFNSIVNDAVSTPLLMVKPGMTASVLQEVVGPTIPHTLGGSLESQLQAIELHASEAISQLGRDMAISLVHLEDEIVGAASPAMQQLSGWRGGALLAGAMVAAVYLHSRRNEEKAQQGTVFSEKLVQVEFPDPV